MLGAHATIRGGERRHDPLPELATLTLADFAGSVLTDVDAAGFDRFVLVADPDGHAAMLREA